MCAKQEGIGRLRRAYRKEARTHSNSALILHGYGIPKIAEYHQHGPTKPEKITAVEQLKDEGT